MSKKRAAAAKGKRRTAAKTKPDWTHRIFLAARSVGKPSVQNHPRRLAENASRLMDLVATALDAGADKHVLRAIEDLEEAHLEDAAEMVAFLADAAGSTIPVLKQSADGVDVGELELLLVPVLLMVDRGHAVPLRLPDSTQDDRRSTLHLCTTSLRRYGLIGEESTVVVLPWLYAYSDLPATWSGQRDMLHRCIAATSGDSTRLPLPQPTDVVTQPSLALRFVLFAVTSALSDTDNSPLLHGGFIPMEDPVVSSGDAATEIVDTDPEMDPRLLAWQEDFAQTLAEGLPGVLSVRAGMPAWWDEAIHVGFDMYNLFGLLTSVAPDGDRETRLSTHAAMGFYLVDGALELRIGLTRDGRFVGGFIWVCHQEPGDELEKAFEALERMGIPAEHIHIATDILGDERCPDCGKPFFPSIHGEGLHEDDHTAPEPLRLH
ncbi:hypothetical protein ACSSZE_09425 [Acidithiobacillus caldus]